MKSIVRSLSFAATGVLLAAAAGAAPAPVTPAMAPAAAAPGAVATAAGTATLVTGHVSAASPSGDIRDLVKGAPVYEGEVIITSNSSYVNIEFTDGGRVLLRPESRFQIDRYQFSGATPDASNSRV